MVDHAWCGRVARRSARPMLSGSSSRISTNGSCRRSLSEPLVLEADSFRAQSQMMQGQG